VVIFLCVCGGAARCVCVCVFSKSYLFHKKLNCERASYAVDVVNLQPNFDYLSFLIEKLFGSGQLRAKTSKISSFYCFFVRFRDFFFF